MKKTGVLNKMFGSDQRGSMMVEAIAMLGLLSMTTPMIFKRASERQTELTDIAVANQTRTLAQAVDDYIRVNYSDIANGNVVGGVNYGAGQASYVVPFTDAELSKFIPINASETNAVIEEYRASIKVTGVDPVKVTGVIAGKSGNIGNGEIGILRGNRIATMIGSRGGYVKTGSTTASGAAGSWKLDTNNYFDASGTNTGGVTWVPGGGSVVATTSYTGTEDIGNFLYRDDVGLPEMNTMHANIHMDGNSIDQLGALEGNNGGQISFDAAGNPVDLGTGAPTNYVTIADDPNTMGIQGNLNLNTVAKRAGEGNINIDATGGTAGNATGVISIDASGSANDYAGAIKVDATGATGSFAGGRDIDIDGNTGHNAGRTSIISTGDISGNNIGNYSIRATGDITGSSVGMRSAASWGDVTGGGFGGNSFTVLGNLSGDEAFRNYATISGNVTGAETRKIMTNVTGNAAAGSDYLAAKETTIGGSVSSGNVAADISSAASVSGANFATKNVSVTGNATGANMGAKIIDVSGGTIGSGAVNSGIYTGANYLTASSVANNADYVGANVVDVTNSITGNYAGGKHITTGNSTSGDYLGATHIEAGTNVGSDYVGAKVIDLGDSATGAHIGATNITANNSSSSYLGRTSIYATGSSGSYIGEKYVNVSDGMGSYAGSKRIYATNSTGVGIGRTYISANDSIGAYIGSRSIYANNSGAGQAGSSFIFADNSTGDQIGLNYIRAQGSTGYGAGQTYIDVTWADNAYAGQYAVIAPDSTANHIGERRIRVERASGLFTGGTRISAQDSTGDFVGTYHVEATGSNTGEKIGSIILDSGRKADSGSIFVNRETWNSDTEGAGGNINVTDGGITVDVSNPTTFNANKNDDTSDNYRERWGFIKTTEGDIFSDAGDIYAKDGVVAAYADEGPADAYVDGGYVKSRRFVSTVHYVDPIQETACSGSAASQPADPSITGVYGCQDGMATDTEKYSDFGEGYDYYQVNPGFTSVMKDIKLASRGGGRLSEMLPDFINKGIYVLENTNIGLTGSQYGWWLTDLPMNIPEMSEPTPPNLATKSGTVYSCSPNSSDCECPPPPPPPADQVSDCTTSPYMGFVPSPLCPRAGVGYKSLLQVVPFAFSVATPFGAAGNEVPNYELVEDGTGFSDPGRNIHPVHAIGNTRFFISADEYCVAGDPDTAGAAEYTNTGSEYAPDCDDTTTLVGWAIIAGFYGRILDSGGNATYAINPRVVYRRDIAVYANTYCWFDREMSGDYTFRPEIVDVNYSPIKNWRNYADSPSNISIGSAGTGYSANDITRYDATNFPSDGLMGINGLHDPALDRRFLIYTPKSDVRANDPTEKWK